MGVRTGLAAMSASVRDREADAIATLVALCGPDGPDEWQPEHYAAAEAAAYVAAEWVRRDGRSTGEPKAKAKRKPLTRWSEPDELEQAKEIVRARSGGLCEASTEVCDRYAVHVHHKRGRVGKGAHDPNLLLDVCNACHTFLHANPELARQKGWMVSRLGVITP